MTPPINLPGPRIVLRLTGLLLAIAGAQGVEPKSEMYVINTKPASVAIVNTVEWATVGTVPLDAEPTYAVISSDNHFLYVLHKGLYRPQGLVWEDIPELTVVDLWKREVVKRMPLASNVNTLALSKNGGYLLCVSQGRLGKKPSEAEHGSIAIIDTARNSLFATLSAGKSGVQVVTNSDLSRIAVLSRGEPSPKKGPPPAKTLLTIFTIGQDEPLAEIEFDRATSLVLSGNEKWLYLLDPGRTSKKPGEDRTGRVHVVDLDAAKLAADHEVSGIPFSLRPDRVSGGVTLLTRTNTKDAPGNVLRFQDDRLPQISEVGGDPRFVRRLGDASGLFSFGYEDIRFVPDDGSAPTGLIPLNPKMKTGDNSLGGVPGELLYLPDSRKLIMTVRTPQGYPTSKVAIVSLAENKVEHVITTGRGSVKFGKFVGAVALSAALTGLGYYGNMSLAQSTGSPFFFYTINPVAPAPPNLELTASTDGKFVYALNTQTNDVTVINVENGDAQQKIPIGGGCRRLGLAPGGRFVYSYTSGQLDLIDTQTNQKHLEHQVDGGHIRNVTVAGGGRSLVALTSKSLLVIDGETGTIVHTLEGFGEPNFLVERTVN